MALMRCPNVSGGGGGGSHVHFEVIPANASGDYTIPLDFEAKKIVYEGSSVASRTGPWSLVYDADTDPDHYIAVSSSYGGGTTIAVGQASGDNAVSLKEITPTYVKFGNIRYGNTGYNAVMISD